MSDALIVRPLDRPTESAYVYSTARRMAAKAVGGVLPCIHVRDRRETGGTREHCTAPGCHGVREFFDWPRVCELVNHRLNTSDITVAIFEHTPDQIMGWVARGPDTIVEWVYLRASFKEAPLQALPVMRALLGTGQVMMRRAPSRGILEAVVAAGLTPRVVPESL